MHPNVLNVIYPNDINPLLPANIVLSVSLSVFPPQSTAASVAPDDSFSCPPTPPTRSQVALASRYHGLNLSHPPVHPLPHLLTPSSVSRAQAHSKQPSPDSSPSIAHSKPPSPDSSPFIAQSRTHLDRLGLSRQHHARVHRRRCTVSSQSSLPHPFT